MFRDIAGYRFFTLDVGAGPRTFSAHSGWIGTLEDWLPTLAVLSKTWRAATYDHRGAGETAVPVDEITPDALVDDVFRVMDAMDVEGCVLAGFSAGTAVVLRALVTSTRSGSRGWCSPTGRPGCGHRRWGPDMLMRAEPAADRLNGLFPPPEPELLERVAALRVRTLILNGELDALASIAAMEHLTSLLPDSKLVVFEGSGHLPLMTRPYETAAAIEEFFAG